ncbi:MAG: HupE/UreJ family protein [Gammaproteobacteria bacterium]
MGLTALVAPLSAQAHATSTSYLVAESRAGDTNVTVTWDVAVADVHWAVGLDDDGNGSITWREIESHRDDIASLAASHLSIARGGKPCDAKLADLLLTEHAGEPHLSQSFLAECPAPGALALSATLFFDKDATQRTLIDITTPGGQFTSILSPGTPRWLEPAAPSALATFGTFVTQGIWHVWIGYDHLSFLLLLLLPSVLRSTGREWQQAGGFRETARDLMQIITAFTLAHSITLALAATGTVSIPVRPIEMAIAASILIAGLLNLFPGAAKARLALAFGFGLVHGFGFANALAELGSHGARLIPTLAGFNIGVEIAQLSLVALVLPLLLRARISSFYATRFMPAASLAAAMAGAAWLAARAG